MSAMVPCATTYAPEFLFTSHSVSRLVTQCSAIQARTRLRAAFTFVLISDGVQQILMVAGSTVHSLIACMPLPRAGDGFFHF
jgi:hypothetical protein